MKKHFLIILCLAFWGSCSIDSSVSKTEPPSFEELSQLKSKVVPFFKPMQIQNYDWLESFPENGQTFEEYKIASPALPTSQRNTIYIQPIGEFSETQKKVLQLTADYMNAFYNLPVKLTQVKPLSEVPKEFQRKNPQDKQIQIKTAYFLDKLLPNLLPNDAAAFICFTNFDLYPDESMNYVFGQATLQNRVGVWSLWRFGNPDNSQNEYKLFLERTLKVAMHETGHMFTMKHCTKYECLMSGVNHLGEMDRRPLDVCPECMAKVAWAMKYQPTERYRNLSNFWKTQGFEDLSKEFAEKEKAVSK